MVSLYESYIFPFDKPIIYPTPFRTVRGPSPSHNSQPEVAEIAFAGLREPWAFPRARRPFFTGLPPAASAAAAVLMEGWELTPRGLPVLLSLFMSDDIATLLAFANPKSAAVLPFLTFGCSRSNFGFQSRGKHVLRNEIR